MSEPSPSLRGSGAASPASARDSEVKDAPNGVASDDESSSSRGVKRKTPDASDGDDVPMAEGGDDLFGSDDGEADGAAAAAVDEDEDA